MLSVLFEDIYYCMTFYGFVCIRAIAGKMLGKFYFVSYL